MRGTLVAIAAAGCFGGNSSTQGPSEATVVFALPDTGSTCAPNTYVGDLAFSGGSAIAVTSQDSLVCMQNGNNQGNQDAPTSGVTFELAGGGSATFATQPVGGLARVAWLGDQPLMAYEGGSVGTDGGVVFQLGTGNPAPVTQPGGTPLVLQSNAAPATIVSDGSGAWMAIWPQPIEPFDDSSFPDNQSAFNPSNGGSPCTGGSCNGLAIFNLDGSIRTSFVTAEQWFCNSMPDCLAQSSTTVFGVVRGDGQSTGMAQIVSFSKGSGSADADFQVVNTVPNTGQSGPTGLGADDAHVVWVLSPDIGDGNAIGCSVFALDLASGSSGQILMTDAFSCDGAAVDGSAAYVAITRPVGTNGNGNTLSGLGIARIGFDQSFASISTGTPDTTYGGPRRVYVLPGSPEQIVAVDPHAVGVIPASAFDGRVDIHP
jgi:hypothetical protein